MIAPSVAINEAGEVRPFFEFNYFILFILIVESIEKDQVRVCKPCFPAVRR